MKNSAKTALGGIITALSLTTMLATTAIPFLTYALPALAGALLILMVIEINKRWAFCAYVAVSFLSFIILADKEAAMMYIAFFGYYPILKPLIEEKIKSNALSWVIKELIFNAAVVAAYVIIIFVMGIPLDDMEDHGVLGVVFLLAAGNVMFVLYDICLTRLVSLYLNKWQKKFLKIFKHR